MSDARIIRMTARLRAKERSMIRKYGRDVFRLTIRERYQAKIKA